MTELIEQLPETVITEQLVPSEIEHNNTRLIKSTAQVAQIETLERVLQQNGLNARHLSDLANSGISKDHALELGYRSISAKEAYDITGFYKDGWIVAYKTPDGKFKLTSDGFVHVRLKPDESTEGAKYLSRANSGCHFYFSPYLGIHQGKTPKEYLASNQPLYIVEGEKKADKLCLEGFPAIAVAGVYSWVHKGNPIEDFDVVNWKHRVITLVPDSDVADSAKPLVQAGIKELAVHLSESCEAITQLLILPNNIDGSKLGADDFLSKSGVEDFKQFHKLCTIPALIETKNKKAKLKLNLELGDKELVYQSLCLYILLKEKWRYRPGMGWYKFDTTHWKLRHEEFEVIQQRVSDNNFWMRRTRDYVGSVKKECEKRATVHEEQWNSHNISAFKNGYLYYNEDGTTTFKNECDPSKFVTHCFPYEFIIGQLPDKAFTNYLHLLTGGCERAIEFIQAYLRWLISPIGRQEQNKVQKVLFLLGEQGSGKSTLLEIAQNLVGSDNVTGLNPKTLNKPEYLFAMADKLIMLNSDMPGFIPDGDLFKQVVSNEPVTIRRMRENTLFRRLGCRGLLAGNTVPIVSKDQAEGQSRRFLVFKVPDKKFHDDNLMSKLKNQIPAILQWILQKDLTTAENIINNADKDVPAIRSGNSERAIAQDKLLQFLVENRELRLANNRVIDKISASELMGDFIIWLKESNYSESVNPTSFGRRIKKLKVPYTINSNKQVFYSLPEFTEEFLLGTSKKQVPSGDIENIDIHEVLFSEKNIEESPEQKTVETSQKTNSVKTDWQERLKNNDQKLEETAQEQKSRIAEILGSNCGGEVIKHPDTKINVLPQSAAIYTKSDMRLRQEISRVDDTKKAQLFEFLGVRKLELISANTCLREVLLTA